MIHRSTYGVVGSSGTVVRTERATWLQLFGRVLLCRTVTVA